MPTIMKYHSLLTDLRFLLFTYSGRISRSEFWFYVLFRAVVFLIPTAFMAFNRSMLIDIPDVSGLTNLEHLILYCRESLKSGLNTIFYISLLMSFGLIYCDTVVYMKRFHDINLPGWFALFAVVPLWGSIYIVIIGGFIRGTQGENRYGISPYRYTD